MFIVANMLAGRLPLSVHRDTLEYIFNGLMAALCGFFSLVHLGSEDRRVLASSAAYKIVLRLGAVTAMVIFVIALFRLLRLARDSNFLGMN